VDLDVQTLFFRAQMPFGWSVSGPMGRIGTIRQCFVVNSFIWLVGQRYDGRIVIF
jgi:hypothetical protein